MKTVEGEGGRTADEDEHLDSVVIGDSPHAAENGVKAGQDHDQDGTDPERADGGIAQSDVHFREQGGKNHAARVDADGDFGDDEGDQRNDGEHIAGAGGKAAFEKLRHGEHQRPGIEGDEDPRQDEQTPGVQFVMGHGHAGLRAGTGQADDVLRTDV